MRSLSEIDTIVKRASKGVGYSWGIAEEVGKNIKLLETYGLSGLKNLNDYFNSLKSKKFQHLTHISTENQSKIPYCPIIAGTSFLDQIDELKDLVNIKIENMSYPILFLPFLSRASEIVGKKISLKIDEKIFLLNFNQNIYSNYFANEILKHADLIQISFRLMIILRIRHPREHFQLEKSHYPKLFHYQLISRCFLIHHLPQMYCFRILIL